MYLLNNKRVSLDAAITVNGITYPNLRDQTIRQQLGVTEVADPVYPNSDEFNWTENEDGTLNVTRKPQEQIDALMFERAKQKRTIDVMNIVVTTKSGKQFDGDESAQGRMARAILVMDDVEETVWVLADNSPTLVKKAELLEALKLAGTAMTDIWITPYA